MSGFSLLSFFTMSLAISPVDAGTEQYDYDASGRLIRRVDASLKATEYRYDASGNLLVVEIPGAVQTPNVVSWTPSVVSRNSVQWISVTGSGLSYSKVISSQPGITVGSIASNASGLTMRLGVGSSVPLGSHGLFIENAGGTAGIIIDVLPEAPIDVQPQPISLAPDDVWKLFTVRMPDALSRDVHFNLSIASNKVVRLRETEVVLPAGQREFTFAMSGLTTGSTFLTVRSDAMLDSISFLIGVSPDFANGLVQFSKPLSLARGQTLVTSNGLMGPVSSPAITLLRWLPHVQFGVMDAIQFVSSPVNLQRGSALIGAPKYDPVISSQLRLFRPSPM